MIIKKIMYTFENYQKIKNTSQMVKKPIIKKDYKDDYPV